MARSKRSRAWHRRKEVKDTIRAVDQALSGHTGFVLPKYEEIGWAEKYSIGAEGLKCWLEELRRNEYGTTKAK